MARMPKSALWPTELYGGPFTSEATGRQEQADAQILRHVDLSAIYGHAAVSNTHGCTAFDNTLDVQLVMHFFGSGQYLTREPDLIDAKSPTPSGHPLPGNKESEQLP